MTEPGGIPLRARGGKIVAYAIVDAGDVEWLSQWPWFLNDKGYATGARGRPQRTIYMHREILGLTHGDGYECDHVNRNRLDNRRANLRRATRAQNIQNRANEGRGSSRFLGVGWNRRAEKWRAYIRVDGRLLYLGEYADEEYAARVAAHARAELHPFFVGETS